MIKATTTTTTKRDVFNMSNVFIQENNEIKGEQTNQMENFADVSPEKKAKVHWDEFP